MPGSLGLLLPIIFEAVVEVTFGANGGSGGFVQFSFLCCDGTADIIQESDYGSSTACVQVSTIVEDFGSGYFVVGGTCTDAC